MYLLMSLYIAALFVALTPGILLRIPKGGSKLTVAVVHGLVFAVLYCLTYGFVSRSLYSEGFQVSYDPKLKKECTYAGDCPGFRPCNTKNGGAPGKFNKGLCHWDWNQNLPKSVVEKLAAGSSKVDAAKAALVKATQRAGAAANALDALDAVDSNSKEPSSSYIAAEKVYLDELKVLNNAKRTLYDAEVAAGLRVAIQKNDRVKCSNSPAVFTVFNVKDNRVYRSATDKGVEIFGCKKV